MSEMVERAAKAIYEKRNGTGCKPWSIQPKSHKEPYLTDAKAVIETLREPTLKMIGAVLDAHDRGQRGYTAEWNTMIDAALNDKSPIQP